MLPAPYRLFTETPAPEEYCRLRVQAGMTPKSAQGAARGLPNSLFAACIRVDGELVGMGRVIGDGGLHFQLSDIAVHPSHQGRGLGSAIVERLLHFLATSAPPAAHVSLLADGPARHLYAKFGFRETAPESVGMDLPIRYEGM